MTTIGDTFTGTDGTTLVNHTATGPNGGFDWETVTFTGTGTGGFSINANRLRDGGSTHFTVHRAHQQIGSDDQTVQITVVSWNEGSNEITIGLIARKDNTNTGTYYSTSLNFDNGTHTLRLFKKVNNTDTTLDSDTVTWVAGDVLKMTVEGNELKVYQNDTERLSGTDSSIPTGTHAGLTRASNSSTPTITLDDFQADVFTSDGGGGGSGAPMEVIQLHEETGSSTSTSIAFNFPSTPTADNHVVLVVTSGNSVTFTAPAGFATDVNAGTSIGSRCVIMSKVQTTGNSFTVTRSTSGGDWRVVGFEIPAAAFDVSDSSVDSGGGIGSLALGPTATTAFANAIAIAGIRLSGNVTGQSINSSFTIAFADNPRMEAAYKILSTTQAVSCTWDWTGTQDHMAGCLAIYGSELGEGEATGSHTMGSLTII